MEVLKAVVGIATEFLGDWHDLYKNLAPITPEEVYLHWSMPLEWCKLLISSRSYEWQVMLVFLLGFAMGRHSGGEFSTI